MLDLSVLHARNNRSIWWLGVFYGETEFKKTDSAVPRLFFQRGSLRTRDSHMNGLECCTFSEDSTDFVC